MARGQGGFARWVLSPCLVPVLGGVSSIERYSDGAPDSEKGAHLNPRGRAPPPPPSCSCSCVSWLARARASRSCSRCWDLHHQLLPQSVATASRAPAPAPTMAPTPPIFLTCRGAGARGDGHAGLSLLPPVSCPSFQGQGMLYAVYCRVQPFPCLHTPCDYRGSAATSDSPLVPPFSLLSALPLLSNIFFSLFVDNYPPVCLVQLVAVIR